MALGRQPWTTCRRHCNSGQCSSRLRTAGTSTPETRGQACWSCTLPVATQLCKGANLNLNSQTCSLYATPACCKICQPRALHLLAQLCEQAAQVSVPPVLFLVLPAGPELCPRACIQEPRPWVFSDEERPFAKGFIGSRATLQKEPGRSSRDFLWLPGAGSRQASSLGSQRPCLGNSVSPLPRENRRLSMGFFLSRDFSSSCIQTTYMGLSTGV